MATIVRGPHRDKYVQAIKERLDEYERAHPGSVAELYRQNTASIRIRILDDHFAGMSAGERHDMVWDFLAAALDDDTLQEISVLLPLAPKERTDSLMSLEFDDPIPSSF
jgi:stress-induced morphogen